MRLHTQKAGVSQADGETRIQVGQMGKTIRPSVIIARESVLGHNKQNSMKQSQILEQIKAGKILFIGKFLHMKKEKVAYRDRETKQSASFDKLEFSLLGANGVVFVQPDTRKIPGFKIETYESPFKAGQEVVVEVEKMQVERGQTTIAGNVTVLES